MSLTRHKLAEVIDAFADYVESNEAQKVAEERTQKRAHVDKIAESYEMSTGQVMPPELREKLAASLDPEVLEYITKAAKHTGDSPESLGAPSSFGEPVVPKTVKEAAAFAEDQFLSWIVS